MGLLFPVSLAWGEPDLDSFSTKNYKVYTDLPRRAVIPYAKHMDMVFDQYKKRFRSFKSRDRSQMPLYLFRTREDYLRFLSSYDIDGKSSGGMFFYRRGFRDKNIQGLATFVEGQDPRRMLEVLQHEGFHQFANAYIGPDLPNWADEGIAEYFEKAIFTGKSTTLGYTHVNRVRLLQEAIDKDEAIDFNELLDISSAQWGLNLRNYPKLGTLQYAQSWSIVHFLIHDANGRYMNAFMQYLKLVSSGRRSGDAFERAFGGDTTGFEKKWKEYVVNLSPGPLPVAVDRLETIGKLLLMLQKRNEPIPKNIDELHEGLTKLYGHSSDQHQPAPKDPKPEFLEKSWYNYTNDLGAELTFRMLEPRADHLLPRVAATGLDPSPTLDWSLDEEKELTSYIEYD